jgi:hydrogenase nickel incorporation protein HypB
MCMTCGCGKGQTLIGGHALARQRKPGKEMHYRVREESAAHVHAHNHTHGNSPARDNIDFGAGPAGAHAPGMSQSRMVKIERDILAKNNDYADDNRRYFSGHGIFALNLVSSPGSGKTTLLVKTIAALNGSQSLAVIEGDQQTDNDAARIRATGAPALQINTGKGCHLDAAADRECRQPGLSGGF